MKMHDVQQGTVDWHKLRNKCVTASEAPAMMGDSKYQSRDDLLKQKVTGIKPEVTEAQQRIFDKGHAAEDSAREIAEKIIGDDLFPVTATDDEEYMLASMDGLTLDGTVGWEHKLYNQKLAEQVKSGQLENHYVWQLEQQALVTGCEKILFMTSDGTEENCEYFWYTPNKDLQEKLVKGWDQFKADMATFNVDDLKEETVSAEIVTDLPAVTYSMNGLALTSDLSKFKEQAKILIQKSQEPMETDNDFATAENIIKVFKSAETKLSALSEQVVGEVSDIDSFIKDLKQIGEEIRQARLSADKKVKAEKERRKLEVKTKAEKELQQYIDEKNALLGGVTLPSYQADFVGAMKGLKTISSIQSAVNDCLANAKIEISGAFDLIQKNIKAIDELAGEYRFLFADLQNLVTKGNDDFVAVVKARIADHKAEEERRKESERQRIEQQRQEEERRKAAQVQQEEAETEESPAIKESLITDCVITGAPDGVAVDSFASKPRIEGKPNANQIIMAVAQFFGVSTSTAKNWIKGTEF